MKMEFERILNLNNLLKNKSFFLFGPRSTGKTTLIRSQLKNALVFDLLDNQVFRALLKNPKLIEERALAQKSKLVVIDEIQKLPSLLDEVHRLIERNKYTFLLTGSSARKLKRGSANLLAGRAWQAQLFSLTSKEIPNFDIITYLNRGGLPQVYNSKFPNEELQSYVDIYLREEIQAEAVTRNVQAFAEFLDFIALSNGEEINYESLASDCQVSPSTIKAYFQILEDTLIGFSLAAYTKTKKRKAISRSKHYLFDIGVCNQLAGRSNLTPKNELWGKAMEHFIVLECRAYLSYRRIPLKMYYWRSTSQQEVDLLIGDQMAIEIKSTDHVQDKHLKGLRALAEENLIKNFVVVSMDPEPRITKDGIRILPWKLFLKELHQNQLIEK